jgi:hypothetical protein
VFKVAETFEHELDNAGQRVLPETIQLWTSHNMLANMQMKDRRDKVVALKLVFHFTLAYTSDSSSNSERVQGLILDQLPPCVYTDLTKT